VGAAEPAIVSSEGMAMVDMLGNFGGSSGTDAPGEANMSILRAMMGVVMGGGELLVIRDLAGRGSDGIDRVCRG